MNAFSDSDLMFIGFFGWIAGIGLIVAGCANWAWIPISFGALAFGFHDGRRHGSRVSPATRGGAA